MHDQLVNCYFILAIGYNLASIISNDARGISLAPTDPMAGISLMSVLYLIYSLETALPSTSRILLLMVLLGLVIRFGIIRHLFLSEPTDYPSSIARYMAAFINVFGVIVISTNLL